MNDSEAIDLLERMVRIPSVSYEEAALVRWLAEHLPEHGFETRIDMAGNIVASIGDGPELGVLLGHVDTVPGNMPVRREGGRLYGRGSVDAKGPLATFIAALSRIDARTLPGRLTIVGCVEEEVASSKGAFHAVQEHRPQWAVIGEPSGWDAVTLGYKGHLGATLGFEQGQSHGAHATPSASERACATWSTFEHTVAAHNEGRERLFDQLLTRLVGIEGGADHDGHDRCTLRMGLRLGPDMPPEEARAFLARTVGGLVDRLEFHGGIGAWSGPRTTPLHRAFLTAIRAAEGRGRALLKTGTADLNVVAPVWKVPALAYGPGDAALDHTPDEHIVLDEFTRAIGVLGAAIDTMIASTSESPTTATSSSSL